MARDITDSKQAEDKLKEANDIINRSPVVVFLWRNDEGWSVEFVSENVKDIFGYTAENFITGEVTYAEVIHSEDMERVAGEVANFDNDNGIKEFTHKPYRIIAKGGEIKWLDNRTRVVTDESGKITHYEGIVLEITDRMRVEDALEKTYYDLGERVKELNCLYGISKLIEKKDVSLEEILQGVVDIISPSWQYPEITCARLTLDNKEFKTKNFKKTKWRQNADIIIRGKNRGSLEVCYFKKMPHIRESPFFKEERNLIEAICERLGRIVEIRDTEEKLKKYSKALEKANEDVKNFTYIVSHDLKTPLINIRGYSDMVKSSMDELQAIVAPFITSLNEGDKNKASKLMDERIGTSLNTILNSVIRMDNMLSSIMMLSRLGRKELDFEKVGISEIVNSVMMSFAYEIQEQKIKINVGELPDILADRNSMEIIFRNLLTNAVNYHNSERKAKIDVGYYETKDKTTF